jgi:hypothetical protein
MVVNPQDSLPYYYNGIRWKPVYVDSLGIIHLIDSKTDSVTVSGNNIFYWSGGVAYGQPLNKLDSIHISNDSIFACIAGNCSFSFTVGSDSTAFSTLIQASDSLSVGIKDKKGRQSNIVILAPDGSSTGVSGSYTASNGDTLIGNDIQLGGSLSKFTTINTGAYPLSLNGNGDASSNVLKLFSTDGQPFWSISVNNLALYAKSTNGHAAEFDINPASTNTVVNTISLFRSSQGTAANGMGTSIDYMLQDASGFIQNSNQLITKWSDATHATLTSEFSITGVNNGSTNNILRIGGNGSAQFYGTVQLKNYTVATLPTGVQGMTAYVTDASSPSYLATVVGGGTVITPVFYNGANWVCH